MAFSEYMNFIQGNLVDFLGIYMWSGVLSIYNFVATIQLPLNPIPNYVPMSQNTAMHRIAFTFSQEPLNIWTKNSNWDSKTPYSFTDTQYFHDFFYKIIFLFI